MAPLQKPANENYAAVVASVRTLVALPKLDRVEGLPLFGHQAVVAKGWQPGDLGVFFGAETQLSHDYARANNLYRKADLNENPSETGYFEENRRVRAQKFRGNVSNAIFMPLKVVEAASA